MYGLPAAHHPLKLLGHLKRLIVLGLTHPSCVQQLLDLLLWVARKRPLELLKPLHHLLEIVLGLHLLIKRITHRHQPSVLSAPF